MIPGCPFKPGLLHLLLGLVSSGLVVWHADPVLLDVVQEVAELEVELYTSAIFIITVVFHVERDTVTNLQEGTDDGTVRNQAKTPHFPEPNLHICV